ncbi:MAG: bifunctional oligoribonuclease/PAP phosphatase NrnA [Lachnospiraceae bacterium]|nr:bifunctional oligoribonuclease/PAP phosphatase NrnA [Lachnospiraceae bacterium]
MNKKIEDIIRGAKTIAISGHKNPDGDCVGSCVALANYIWENFPNSCEVSVYFDRITSDLRYLKEDGNVILWKDAMERGVEAPDLFVIVDCSTVDRLGILAPVFEGAKRTFCIDHHVSNDAFADGNVIVPDASSTCEVLYDLMDEERISQKIAEELYLGIVHDTGVFKYAGTSEHTMQVAGRLMSKGIDTTRLIDETFYEKTYIQNQILGRALLESILFMDKKCIFSAIRKAQMDFYGVTGADLGGIVEQLRLTAGVECAIFLYEIGELEYKVSMRSKNLIDVSKVAKYFGGGGHIRAAGCEMKGTMHDVLNNISARIEMQFKEMAKREKTVGTAE